ncbi:ethylene receptor 2-like [Iris pallida]|uniref:Ethylene receptor n=1 Tax=Iris pallida TaxID=29817 RepID=A0AAX6IDR2_IRIPA|nr:ethylene receptor 2-like [Iris pallida]
MLRALCHGLLVSSLVLCASAVEIGRCNCDSDSLWSVEAILQCQKVSDFLIATAYFSIPLELLYFATCSTLFPFKWIVLQFGAFIVLCGLTHLLNVFTYEPHTFLLMLSLTISKFFTALVSFATAITLLTLIPQLLRLKVRENFLWIKARELDREVGRRKRQEEASWHVRMLTHEIRKSLDKHTILYTTLVELSNALRLQNCAVWMPSEDKKEMNLTHVLRPRNSPDLYSHSIPMDDPDVIEIKEVKGVKILRPDSMLASASSEVSALEPGPVAAIRMPLLYVSNFKGGTPEVIQACYAILVLVLPGESYRVWSSHELEIVEVVADQVTIALSHAALLEESKLMRDKLVEQNRALLIEKRKAVMASEARNSFQRVMSQGMGRPIHSTLGLLSLLQQENLSPEQRLVIDTMTKTSSVISILMNDVMDISTINSERLTLELRSFQLHSMLKEAASVARCLCYCKGFGFRFQVENVLPDRVMGDEKRIFQVILHMVGNLINGNSEAFMSFRVCSFIEDKDRPEQGWMPWKSNFSEGYSCVKFEIRIQRLQYDPSSSAQLVKQPNSEVFDTGLSFSMCKRIAQMMQGNIWVIPNPHGLPETITLMLQFQLHPVTPVSELGGSLDHQPHMPSTPNFKGLRVLVADDDDVNRAVTRKLLEKLGCHVTSVSSGPRCLSALGTLETPQFQLVILDLLMPRMDGFEVATKIRKLRRGSWPAIVGLTTSAEDGVWQRCLELGMNGLIRKPILLQAMRDELYRVLHNT